MVCAAVARCPGPLHNSGSSWNWSSGGQLFERPGAVIVTSDVVENVADRVIERATFAIAVPFRAGFAFDSFFIIFRMRRRLFQGSGRVLVPGGGYFDDRSRSHAVGQVFFSDFSSRPLRGRPPGMVLRPNDSMMDANQALSWMVFVRDAPNLRSRQPAWKIEGDVILPWLTFPVRGVTARCLIRIGMNGLTRGR